MRAFFEDILNMPYYKNYAATSGAVHNISKHEDAVEDLLKKHGCAPSKIQKISKSDRDSWMRDSELCSLKNGEYISQPCGTHDSPDFIVKNNNKVYFLECKSTSNNTSSPMYNSGVPKPDYIYIYSAEKTNETTIFMGHHVLPRKEYEMIMEHTRVLNEATSTLNGTLTNDYGISYYVRPMMTHKGGQHKTNYFTNPNRHSIESDILTNYC